ncbi:hypothetical protein ONE63_002312 [Megalurothrips usitatus]|uniref:Sodium-coupled monocarboxylate transporter 1-like n=1 Tax=Megalurothrips usitatus TaxID=439358 RepID=A0AAV7XBK3_9NEOP|nr:hypothetical protein ONE63_002312 [Megalurothrips usitatus]
MDGPAPMQLGWVDQAAFAFMLTASALIGVYFAYFAPVRNQSASEYLVGGRSMGTVPIALSLISSYISGITLLGYPAEVYVYGMQVLYKMLALPFMGIIFATQLLPVFRDLGGISLYGYFARRFNNSVRLLASCLFIFGDMCYMPLVVFVPSFAYQQLTTFSIHWVAPVVCLICIYYTTVGGIKAVVWTDAIQAVSMYMCVLLVMVLGVTRTGGVSEVWARGVASTRIEAPVLDLDMTTRHTLFTMMVGAFIAHCAHAGLGQAMMQRYLSLPTDRQALTAMWIFIGGICTFFLTSGIAGLVMYAYYYDCDPIQAKRVSKPDQMLVLFVMETVGGLPGVAGLFISGVFSAALSSMSCALNAMAAVVLEDWVRGYGGYEPSERHASWIMRGVVVVFGLIALALVFVVQHLGMVVQLAVSLSAVSTGPLFTLFVVGLFLPWCNTRSAVAGALTSTAFTITIVFGQQLERYWKRLSYPEKPFSVDGCLAAYNITVEPAVIKVIDNSGAFPLFRISYLWFLTLSLLVGVTTAGVAAFLGWRNDLRDVDPRLLAPLARRLLPAKLREDAAGARTTAAPDSAATAAEQALLLADLRVSLQNLEKHNTSSEAERQRATEEYSR